MQLRWGFVLCDFVFTTAGVPPSLGQLAAAAANWTHLGVRLQEKGKASLWRLKKPTNRNSKAVFQSQLGVLRNLFFVCFAAAFCIPHSVS